MIIVSQDKTEFVNLDNVTRIFIEDFSEDGDGFGIGADTNSAESQCWDLGYYETEDRAKEVLTGMINAYEKAGNITFETDDEEKLMRLTHNSTVFEMPKE